MSDAVVGVDVGGTHLKAVAIGGLGVDGQLEIIEKTMTRADGSMPDELAMLVSRELFERHRVTALGVGVAGLVSWPDGSFLWGPHRAGASIPVRSSLQTRLGIPVVVDNDCNTAAYAEAVHGAGRGHDHVLSVTFGTGIGAGIVISGSVYRGRSFAGEVGHMSLDPEGRRCACGRIGCWETLVSGGELDRLAAGLLGDEASAEDLVSAARGGDAAARDRLSVAARWLGRGVANLVSVLDPEIVVLGGGMMDAGEEILEPAREAFEGFLSGGGRRPEVPLVLSHFGRWGGAVGAAALARTIGSDD